MTSLARVAITAIAIWFTSSEAFAARPIVLGQTISGELAKGDTTLADGEFTDTYRFVGRAGQRITIRMRSSAIDPYLMIRGPGGFTTDNDDASSDDRNALLDVRLPSDGTYSITATSYRAATGDYTIALTAGGSGTPAPNAPRPTSRGTIQPGQTVQGTLERTDIRLGKGEYQDIWIVQARRGQRFVARLSSTAFDPYLVIRGPGDLSEDNDDDATARGSHNSRVEFTAAADGEIRIGATSYKGGETGVYTLALDLLGSGPSPSPAPPSAPPDGVIVAGGTVSGRLAQGDSRQRTGELYDSYSIVGRRGQQIELRLSSADFDPYLMVTGPGDLSISNDDDPDGRGSRDSHLIVNFPEDGTYRISVTSYRSGENGAYRLSAASGTGSTTTQSTQTAAGPLTIGQTVSGALTRGDRRLDSGEYADRFRFTGRRGQRVALDLTSAAFDAYLILQPPSGQQRDNDDGGEGSSTNSRLELALPEDGEYTVMVTSYRSGETGSYQFSLKPSEGTVRMQAARPGERIFAVMVGISDYGGSGRANLPYTAQDATKMAEALRRAGVLNPASVTLTDAAATRAGVRAAIQRVAEQAGPQDVFLFFYSGHGGQRAAPNQAIELDGRSETLVLRDGELTDEELRALLAPLRTRMSFIVLDSCFSGGFARNLISRPGVMGLFSSEEDLTSSVAQKFRAGGYLSHFVREGLSGQADADSDRIVTAGEIAAYVRAQFAREVRDVEAETSDGQRNYQNLVIDRGGVQVDDAILRLAR